MVTEPTKASPSLCFKTRPKHGPPKRIDRRAPAGFTLVELMIVFLVMGIIAAIGLPSLNGAVDEKQLSGAASEVVTALEFAQLTAMTEGGETRVSVDTAAETLTVERYVVSGDLLSGASEFDEADVESGAYEAVPHPLERGEDYVVNLTGGSLFRGVDITSVDFSSGTTVSFSGLGAPSSGGTVTLSVGGSAMVVTVDSLSGKVTVSN